MKKILTSVFILACCMGGSYGDASCSMDQCTVTNCDKCYPDKKNIEARCSNNYVIKANHYLTPHYGGSSQSDGPSSIQYCYCKRDSIYAECAAGYYGDSVYCKRNEPTNQTEETWVPGCDFCTTSCTKCPDYNGTAGTSSEGTTSVTGCKCPADSYMTKDAQDKYYCQGCPEHSNTLETTGKTKVSHCTCEAGYYMTDSNECAQINGTNYTDNGNTFSCDNGYYKNNDKNGCKQCPAIQDNSGSDTENYTTTTYSGATSIQECFIPQGTEFCDEKGCGTYTDNAGHN